MKPLHKLVLGSILAMTGLAHAEEIPTTPQSTPLVGQGYNTEEKAITGQCLDGDIVYEGMQQSNVGYISQISEETMASELGISGDGKAKYGMVKASASAKFYTASKSDAFSISANYVANYAFKNRIFSNPHLKEEAKKFRDDPERFKAFCGDEFVAEQNLGGKLFFSIRIDFLSQQEKSEFGARFHLESPFVEVGAALDTARSSMGKRTKVTINILQIGGQVEKLTGIFEGTGADRENQPYNLVQCSSGDFTKCQLVLRNAIAYASDSQHGFPAQLTEGVPQGGPAVLSSQSRSYKTAGEFIGFSPEMDRQLKLARTRISDTYDQAFDQYTRAVRIRQQGVIRLSDRQALDFTQKGAKLYASLQRIVEASTQCFDKPKTCSDEFALINPDTADGIKLFSENDFLISPETFVQYCDLGQSPVSEKPLASTIASMISVAQKVDPEPFKAQAGEQVDTCNAASGVFTRQTDLNFDDSGITDLRPIGTLTGLESLSLRRNGLVNLQELSKLTRLSNLNLSGNKVVDVRPLMACTSLQTLNLSDNRISNVAPLNTLTSINQIDLRNNEPGISCPFTDISTCLMADFRHNNAFVEITKLTPAPRLQHASVMLDSGKVLVVGGYEPGNVSNKASELFDPNTNEFTMTGAMSHSRRATAVTKLTNGQVLVTGGWGGLKSAELYNPQSETFTDVLGNMNSGRAEHTATLLKDGRVLVVGGWIGAGGFWTGVDASPTADVFEPSHKLFYAVGSTEVARAGHTATLLKDGTVLVVGGYTPDGGLASAEIFNPETNTFQKLSSRLNTGRSGHTALLLPDGKVLIAGGYSAGVALNTAEIFDPAIQGFVQLSMPMNEARGDLQSVSLSDGKVLLVGGRSKSDAVAPNALTCEDCSQTAEVYDPITRVFTSVSQPMHSKRAFFTLTALPGLRFLVLGGMGAEASHKAEIFEYSN